MLDPICSQIGSWRIRRARPDSSFARDAEMSSTTADTAVRSQTAAATEGRGDLLSPVLARLKRRRSGAAIVFRGGDRELRQGGRWTIVLAGVATQFGVESAVRQAWELDYQLMVAR